MLMAILESQKITNFSKSFWQYSYLCNSHQEELWLAADRHAYNPGSVTRLNIPMLIFPFREHHDTENKQEYSHSVKLPDGRSGRIRLFTCSEVSRSIPRTRNKQRALLWWWAGGRGPGEGTQHIASKTDEDTATSCVAGPLRAGEDEADPEPPEIGSLCWR